MRQPTSFLRAAAFSAAAASLALALSAAQPATAQTVVTTTKTDPVGAIRLGVLFPFDTKVTSQVGRTFFPVGGLDYAIQHKTGVNRTIISLDYIERNSKGKTLRVYPLTIGQQVYIDEINGVHPYGGYGIGAYFVHTNVLGDNNIPESHNATTFGGYLLGGLDFQNNIFLEGRYQYVQSVGSIKPDGLQLDAGYRF